MVRKTQHNITFNVCIPAASIIVVISTDSTLQLFGMLTAGGLHGWHNWSEGVPAAGNTRPRPSEDKPAGDSVTGKSE